MLPGLTILLLCQLVGEGVTQVLDLPLPGPVIGLVVLFAVLTVRGRPEPVEVAADGLLRHLSLLFVPAGVGVVQYLSVIATEALPIGLALVGSTLLTIAATAWVMQLALGRVRTGESV